MEFWILDFSSFVSVSVFVFVFVSPSFHGGGLGGTPPRLRRVAQIARESRVVGFFPPQRSARTPLVVEWCGSGCLGFAKKPRGPNRGNMDRTPAPAPAPALWFRWSLARVGLLRSRCSRGGQLLGSEGSIGIRRITSGNDAGERRQESSSSRSSSG